jgi:hypothetical protein
LHFHPIHSIPMAAPRRRWFWLCAIGAAVLGLHLAALLWLGPAWFDPDAPVAARLPVRSVVLPALAPAVADTPAQVEVAVEHRHAAAARAAAPRALAASVPAATVLPIDPRPEPSGQKDPLPDPLPEPSTSAAMNDAASAIDIPVYATRLPPPGRWLYRMQRGVAIGVAELSWAPQVDASYELHLQGRVAGLTLLDWASQGQLDAAGIAPERFAVRRRGRDVQAANFQHGSGKITFSGPKTEWPLLPGAQDRLSWLLQLPGVVAAAPERFAPGASVVLFVAGARGDADVWTFVVQGSEPVGGTPALRLLREPSRLYGLRAEVWLDPAAHYLPLRVLQTPAGGGATLELLRERDSP